MAQTKGGQKSTKWPNPSEYVDSYILPSLMPSKPDPWSTDRKIDMLSGRPRTPNDQYTVLNEQQLKNLRKDATPFFMFEDPSGGPGSGKAHILPTPIDRYTYDTSQHLFRDTPPRSKPHCWIGEQWQREPPEQHDTSRLGASLPWGRSKTGQRTVDHFHKEDVHRYLNIDVYKRPPTNIPSIVVMKYGRPSEGYYQQRNPNFNTWFGSTHQLNETNILTNIQPKTFAEYEQFRNIEQNYGRHKALKWPEISEYSDKYLLRTKEEIKTDRMEATKQFHRERRRLEAEALLKSQAIKADVLEGMPADFGQQPVPA